MDSSRLVAITITWARTFAETARLRRSLSALVAAGMPLVICDRGSDPAFAAFLRTLPRARIVAPAADGLVAQVQAAAAAAADTDRPFALYTEPDKEDFFVHRLSEFVRRVPDEDDLGVALASRSPGSFASFPPVQRYTERVINDLAGGRLGLEGDYSYGPFVLNRSLFPQVARLDRRVGWGWRHSTFLAAARLGLRVVHVPDNHACPADQQQEDESERRHRLRQLSENVLGLLE